MIKVLAICGNGMGTSLVIKMKVKKFLDAQGVEAKMESCSLGEATGYLSQGIDIALCSQNLVKNINKPEKTHIIGLKNLMDDKEFGPPLMKVIEENFSSELEG